MKKVLAFLKHEMVEMLPPTIFFLIAFHVVTFARALMAGSYGISALSSASATVGALIVGKSILVVDALPLFSLFRQKRLIYNVAWRVLLYAIIVLLFQFLEELIPVIKKYGAISTAAEHLLVEIEWPRFWATHIILVFFLGIYAMATAIVGAIGRRRILEILFSTKSSSSPEAN